MFEFDIAQLFPRFVLNDTNGYALARAIEAALKYFLEKCQEGLDCVLDVDKMPEWRLDEMAWELNCLYDFNAGIEAKRIWIKNAIPYYRLFGTPQAVYQFLSGYFDEVELEENWNYGADPFHFRVTVEGTWTPENESWARRAIEAAKNVRSVLDALRIGCKCSIGMTAEGEVRARFRYPLTGAENWAGRWPQTNIEAVIDKSMNAAVEADAEGWRHDYPLTGTVPGINTEGVIDRTMNAAIDAIAEGWRHDYPLTGTAPEINTMGVLNQPIIPSAEADVISVTIPYIMCGQDEI